MPNSNFARFLTLIRVIVDETRKDSPLTQAEIIRRCERFGVFITPVTFNKYIKEMEQAGIFVERRFKEGKKKGAYLYWYDAGWI